MPTPGAPEYANAARPNVAPTWRSKTLTIGVALGLMASFAAVVGCSEDQGSDPTNQNGLSPANGGSSSGAGGAQGGTSPGSASGGSSAGTSSGGTESTLPTDIAGGSGGSAGSGGSGGAPSAGTGGSAAEPDAGSTPVTDPTAFAPCPTDGSACRIMPLGDSITDGIDPTVQYASNGGYRLELFRLATTEGHNITFVGTRPPNGPTGNVAGRPFPRNHEGISGNTIQQVSARVDAALAANPPDIVLLQIGTNNLYQGMAANVPGQLEGLIDQIIEGAPDALLVVAQVTPLGTGQFPNNGVQQYNALIPGMVQERVDAGKHVIIVNQFTRIGSTPNFVAQLLPDSIHPNAAGYAIMGQTWYDAIETFLP